MLNEAMNVVAALEFESVGEVVMLKEVLADGERALVVGHTDEEKVVRLAEPLLDGEHLRVGESLLLEPRSGYVYERVPKSEVEELVLEEVPDIDYSLIGGLAAQIEMIRDAVLSASGLLSQKIGGQSVFPPQPDGIWDNPYSDAKWVISEGEDRYRRGLYTFIRRTSPYPSFMTFDAVSREFCTVRRVRTNTPLQALTMLNDEAFFEAARALAARSAREASTTSGRSTAQQEHGRADYMFRLCTSRLPTSAESDHIVASYERQLAHYRSKRADAAKVLKEPPSKGPDQPERAAWTLVANALLNLDETVTH